MLSFGAASGDWTEPRRPGRLHHHDQLGAQLGGGERGRLQRGQAGDGGAGTTAGADAAGVVDHHRGVVAGDAKVNPEQTTASVKDGVLTITLGKAAEAQPRQINVRAQ